MLICPSCGSKVVGKVGADQFYCWDCCIEFSYGRQGLKMYTIDDEGSLVAMAAAADHEHEPHQPQTNRG